MIFIETQAFTKLLNELMAKEDYRSFQNELVANPTLGDVIKDAGGLRKVRVGAKGKGKRRGARVIYLYFVSESQIAMLYIYSKNEETDLTAEQCKVLKEDDIELEETGMSKFFEGLLESVQQMDEIAKGARARSRETYIDDAQVKVIRLKTGLSQAKFTKLFDVPMATVPNWEQGRRKVTGPARALFKALNADPKNVIKAIQAVGKAG